MGSKNARLLVSTHAVLNYVWDGSTWVAESQPGASTATSSTQVSITGTTIDSSGALYVNAGSGAASTQVSVKELLTSSGGSVLDSSKVSVRVTVAEQSTGPLAVSSIAGRTLVDQNSTTWAVQMDGRVRAQNSTIGDLLASVQQNSSAWQVQPGSTNWPKAAGLSVDSSNVQNVKLDGSTAITIGSIAGTAGRINVGSTAADNAVLATPVSTAYVKSAGFSVDTSNALNVKLDGSTRINLGSTAADNAVTATILAGSTLATRPMQSSQADLRVTVYQSTFSDLQVAAILEGLDSSLGSQFARVAGGPPPSTIYGLVTRDFLYDASGLGIESSTFAASTKTSTVRGLMVRQAVPDCTSATARLATAGDNTILTSAATTIHVYAMSFSAGLPSTGTSTGSSGVVVQLQVGTTGARIWTFNWQPSSNGEGAHEALAVTPPAYLFRTGAGGSLNAAAGSSGGYISVAAWRE